MKIFDETSCPQHIVDIYTPLVSEYMWILNCADLDFMLSPIQVLEEIDCPTLTFRTHHGNVLVLPANWSVLICDRDTAQLDTITLAESAGREFTALTYGPRSTHPSYTKMTAVDYCASGTISYPCLAKHQMLCYPISSFEWICISPSDPYNKYLKDRIIGDLIT